MQAAKEQRVHGIGTRLRKIVLAPTAALIALWLVVTGYLGYSAVLQYALVQGNRELLTPSAVALTAVMDERSATIAFLEDPDGQREALRKARATSDEHMSTFLDKFKDVLPYSPEPVQQRLHDLDEQFSEIEDFRAHVDDDVKNGEGSRKSVLNYYNDLSEAGADLFEEVGRAGHAAETIGPGMTAVYTFRVVDTLGRADAQLARGLATGQLSRADQVEFTRLVGSYRGMIDALHEYYGPDTSQKLKDLRGSDEWARLEKLENTISDRPIGTTTDPITGESRQDLSMPVDAEEWHAAYDPVKSTLTDIGAEQSLQTSEIQEDVAVRAIIYAVAGSIGIAVLSILAFGYARRAAENLIQRLNRLRDDTRDLSEVKLPTIMDRLSRHEPVDLDSELPDLISHQENDEIGQVANSFDTAQRTAVQAAVRQAELREGINRVFLNIAHRSQTLVHRQLRLLDKMEHEQEDPEHLTELFKLDHLATRSRRNAENLLILGGETPGRTWHRPMPLIDVLRGAISESGDYTRVERQHIARVQLKGPAVADVIHLVAELVDNATTFSPPHTQVRLSSDQVPNGVVVEIEDRGLGMREDEFEAANELLAHPPEFDVMRLNEKMRLGLFVVSRLAHRHDIKVQLRSSPYGGVQAIVLLPTAVIAGDPLALPQGVENTGEQRIISAREERADGDGTDGTDGSGTSGDDTGAGPDTASGPSARGPATISNGTKQKDPTLAPGTLTGDVLASTPTPPSSSPSPSDTGPRPALPRREPRPGVWKGADDLRQHSQDRPKPPALPRRREATPDDASPVSPAPADASAPTDTPTASEEGSATSKDGRPALPRRTPQVNLAPQLSEEPEATPAPASSAQQDADRSARLRRNMAAFQQGTERGRLEAKQRQNDSESEKDSRS
ncbi:nitrate- and nitrite sensing domain-containing protein [Nocardiopsis rhodophaea]|uniref:sensor histidine kinase n=1 Tax=Nocardiopsis rhodophaea TaxID=280238 RepID=UPI0031E46765